MAIALMAFTGIGLAACGDDDDSGSSIPAELPGTWYKVSGDYKHSMQFTFNADGTGSGYINHNSIISMNSFAFKYTYKSNGEVDCKGTRLMVDEDSEEEVPTTLKFQYSGSTMTLTGADNSGWLGAVFNKSGIADDTYDDGDDDGDDEPLNVSLADVCGTWHLAGFGKSMGAYTGSNPSEYMTISSSYSITWGGQQNGRTDYYNFSYSNNIFSLTPQAGSKGSRTTFEIVSYTGKEMVLYQSSSGYYRKWTR